MSSALRTALLAVAAGGFAFTPNAPGQTLITLEGTFPSAGEFSIDPPNACGYPTQSANVWFMPDFTSTCGSAMAFAPQPVGLLGDTALDKVRDLAWATDGLTLVAYSQGLPQITFVVTPGTLLTGALTGIGFDSENDRLWLTDGTDAVAITPPTTACPTSASIAVPAFPLPTPGIVTDIEWDSWTDSLWITDTLGQISNVTTSGALGAGGSLVPGLCALQPPLSGIAFDSATNTLFVTDGVAIEHITKAGTPAPATFYAPMSPCNTAPPPGPPAPLSGLAWAPRPMPYGAGCATIGATPSIGFTGSFSTSPNAGFGITLTGAVPFTPAALLLSLDAPCPGIPWGVCEILAFAPFLVIQSATDMNGDASVPLPIPAFPAGGGIVGTTVFAQWLVLPVIGRQSTEGLGFTLSTL